LRCGGTVGEYLVAIYSTARSYNQLALVVDVVRFLVVAAQLVQSHTIGTCCYGGYLNTNPVLTV
jgi:hypothetical protein